MFSGIVQRQSPIHEVFVQNAVMRLGIDVPRDFTDGLALGASVAVDGVCLTVVGLQERGTAWCLLFDVIPETLERTTLQTATPGRIVNLERSLRLGEEIGGHLVSGHVKCQLALLSRTNRGDSQILRFGVSLEQRKYVFLKGFIALDGASLTVSSVGKDYFEVQLIPETIARTTLGSKLIQEMVNWEVDTQTQAIVDTLERLAIQVR